MRVCMYVCMCVSMCVLIRALFGNRCAQTDSILKRLSSLSEEGANEHEKQRSREKDVEERLATMKVIGSTSWRFSVIIITEQHAMVIAR